MRRLFALVLLLPTIAVAQTPLGDRLGPDVSPAEQRYFGLFPDLAGFQSLRVETLGDSARLIVSRGSGPDTTYALRPGQLAALRRFTETFEQSASPFLNPNWQVAAGTRESSLLDAGALVPYVDPSRAQVEIRRGDRVLSGLVLDARPDRLVLHPVAPYDWRAPQAVAIPASEIAWVDLQPVGAERLSRLSPLIGAGVGLAVAGADVFFLDGGTEAVPLFALATGAGIVFADQFLPRPPPRASYAERLDVLSERAAFRQLAPVDYAGPGADEAVLEPRSAGGAGAAGTLARWRQAYGWINVAAVGGASSSADATGAVQERVRIGGTLVDTTPTLQSGVSQPAAGVDIALRPVPWVRLGATWLRHEGERPSLERAVDGTPTGPEVAYVTPGAVRGYAELVIPSPRRGGFGLEAAVGAGLTTSEATVERASTVANEDLAYRFTSTSSGPFLSATVELVTPRRTSFFVRWTSIPAADAISVPSEERRSARFPDLITYQRDAHEVTFEGYRDLVWGTRFRL